MSDQELVEECLLAMSEEDYELYIILTLEEMEAGIG